MKHTRKIKIDGFEVLEATTDNEVKKKMQGWIEI